MALNADGTKTCPKCEEAKLPAGNFYRSGRPGGDGFAGYCILCAKVSAAEWQRAMPEDRRLRKNAVDSKRKKQPGYWTQERRAARAASVRRWISHNKEKQRAWQQEYKARDPERSRQRNAIHNNRARAKRLGLETTFQWIDWVHILEAFEYACAFCGASGCLLDLEHLVPMSQGGPNTVGNVVPACRPCNAQKCRRPLEDFAKQRGITAERLAEIAKLAAQNG